MKTLARALLHLLNSHPGVGSSELRHQLWVFTR